MQILTTHPIPYQGSKRRLAPIILEFFPPDVGTLYEPFAGSAAVSLAAVRYRKAQRIHLNDSLAPLIEIWRLIIDAPKQLSDGYEYLWRAQLSNPREYYDRVRDRFNATQDPIALLFLLARCVKNAVRFNSAGEFNQSPDKRRLGTRPERMRSHIMGAHRLLAGRTTVSSLDYADILSQATSSDLVYMDPPYQGTSGKRDQRYYEQLDYERFVRELKKLRARNVPFIISFDGRCGTKSYGRPLPPELGLVRIEIHAGRSSQATLNGKAEETIESLYVTPELVQYGRSTKLERSIKESAQQLIPGLD